MVDSHFPAAYSSIYSFLLLLDPTPPLPHISSRRLGWRRVGENIKYYRNNIKIRREDGSKGPDRYFYSLTWTCTFPYSHDTCYFAHCYPYTYSDLQDYLLELANNPLKSRICKQRVFCRTLAGNLVREKRRKRPQRSYGSIRRESRNKMEK